MIATSKRYLAGEVALTDCASVVTELAMSLLSSQSDRQLEYQGNQRPSLHSKCRLQALVVPDADHLSA